MNSFSLLLWNFLVFLPQQIVFLSNVAWVGRYCSFRAGNISFQVLLVFKVSVEKFDVLKLSIHFLLQVFNVLILIRNGKVPSQFCLVF